MENENLKKQMVVKLGTTTNTEAQLISNMVDGALSGKGGNDPTLESLKKQMVIKLGTTTNEDAQIISNMVDNAAGGGGGEVEINNPTLTINYHQQFAPGVIGDLSNNMFLNIFQAPSQTIPVTVVALYNNVIGFDYPMPNESGTVEMYMLPTTTTAILFSDNITDITSDNANNCQLVSQQGMTILMVLNNGENASIDLDYTIGGDQSLQA